MTTQREMEMARGAQVAARHAAEEADRNGMLPVADQSVAERREILARWEEANKLYFRHSNIRASTGPEGFTYNKTAIVNDMEIVSERFGDAWPSENYVAQVGLAISAMTGFAGTPDVSARKRYRDEKAAQDLHLRKQRDEARARQSQWRQIHEPHTLKK